MFGFGYLPYGLGFLLTVLALIHWIRSRPGTYWLFIIFLLPTIGPIIYLAVEALPDIRDPEFFKVFPRRRRIRELEAVVTENPSAGNFEELGQLYLDEGKWQKARDAYNRSISARTDSPDPFYRRGVAEVELGEYLAAVPDLERAVQTDPKYDFQRAAGLLAFAYGKTGQNEKADKLFADVVRTSTLTETQYHYAEFLAAQCRKAEAKQWLQRIIAKRQTQPGFLRRRERKWYWLTRKLMAMM
ncbi:MAG: tetratricopeptide repeat protein [Terriglobia bacterium]|jgi:hypothetical protein|nr:tetratricopeptide repeat protein [Terriglobia bacterium]